MTTPTTFNPELVYRVALESDTEPHARLAIGPVWDNHCVRFFDTLRRRVIRGEIMGSSAADADTVCFVQSNGVQIQFEPLTLERYNEIAHQIDGQPDFASTDEVQSFYKELAGISI